jgi:histone H3/H4
MPNKKDNNKDHSELLVKSKVKEMVKEMDMNSSADIFEALGDTVARHVTKAVERAKANGRKTLRKYDF